METLTTAPTRDEIVARAAALVPALKDAAPRHEQERRLDEDTVAALAEAGLFRLRTPRRYGGYEADNRTLVEVAAELGRGSGAAAWSTAVSWIPTWMACMFPDEVQDEVFTTPDPRVCGTLSPTGVAAPADGGIVVNGKWGFITGALHATWQVVIAVLFGDGPEPYPVLALVPMSELTVVDDWHTSGLAGSGSVSTVAQDVFVPAARYLPLPAVLQEQYASEANAGSPVYRTPLLPTASAASVGAAIGLARGAIEGFMERMIGRKISYTSYGAQAEAPIIHLKVAEARMRIDEAEFHAFRLADLVDGKGARGESWTVEELAQARGDMGAACRLAKEAIDLLASASGGSSLYRDVPIQRIARDINAITLHALMNPDTNAELYGRILCGQAPNTLYI